MKRHGTGFWGERDDGYHRSLQGAVLEDVRKVAFFLSIIFVGLFTMDAFSFPPVGRPVMLVFDAALVVFFAFLAWAAGTGRLIRSHANAWGALLGVLTSLNILTGAVFLKSDLLYTGFLGLTLIATASMLLSHAWLAAATGVVVAAWAGVLWWFPTGKEGVNNIFVFGGVIAVAFLMLSNRIKSFSRLQRIRAFAGGLLHKRTPHEIALALGRTVALLTGAAEWSVQWVTPGAPLTWVDGKGALSRREALRRAHAERSASFDAALAAGAPFPWEYPPDVRPPRGFWWRLARPPVALALPLLSKGTVLGILWVSKPGHRGFRVTEFDVVETCVAQARAALDAVALLGEVQQLATTDELTGLFNRRQFFFLAERENARRRGPGPGGVAVVMADIDHFKKVNDAHGHGVGDIVLREVARRLKNGLRLTDVLGRYGGEEFAVLLPDTSPEQAREIVERLRRAVAATPIEAESRFLTVTASFGIASRSAAGENLERLLTLADHALYRAKDLGRNRVEVHTHDPPL